VDYPAALEQGWTIATGIIEGACRHFVEGSTDLTGARWRELRAPRLSSNYEPCTATATSTPTGHGTSPRNNDASTNRYLNSAVPRAA
jgi:hypothetical protein